VIGRGKVRGTKGSLGLWSGSQFIMTCGLDLRGTAEGTGVLVGPYIFLGTRLIKVRAAEQVYKLGPPIRRWLTETARKSHYQFEICITTVK